MFLMWVDGLVCDCVKSNLIYSEQFSQWINMPLGLILNFVISDLCSCLLNGIFNLYPGLFPSEAECHIYSFLLGTHKRRMLNSNEKVSCTPKLISGN